MLLAKFKKNVGMRVELSPPACDVDDDGEHERDRHDDWLIQSVSDETIEIKNLRTDQLAILGKDQIQSFTSNPHRSRPGHTHGLLRLSVQVVFQGEHIQIRLTPRPGEPAIRPQRLAAKHLTVIKGGLNKGVITQTLTIQTKRAPNLKIEPPAGSIGADTLKRNYIEYLIQQYHKFREADPSFGRTQPYSYAVVRVSIARHFKAKAPLIPVDRFDELVEFLQHKIENTILGRNNRKKGHRCFDTFEEYRIGQSGGR